MSDKPYERMTHDEILREHAARYAQMTPEERAREAEEKARLKEKHEAAERERLSRWRNQQLSELTLGNLTDAIEEAMHNSIVPELKAIVTALEEIERKLD